jgi:hypothetical protein
MMLERKDSINDDRDEEDDEMAIEDFIKKKRTKWA